MADTFTGLKLQGELGRFGRTQISDIEGYVELPDGKVLSGCDWGNLLLWDGGLIKVEVTKRGRKSCHSGPIMQILLDEGELITVGVDGYIRVSKHIYLNGKREICCAETRDFPNQSSEENFHAILAKHNY